MSDENPYAPSQVETLSEDEGSKTKKFLSNPIAIRSLMASVVFLLLLAMFFTQIIESHNDDSNLVQSATAREEVMFFAALITLPSIIGIICAIPCLIWGNRFVMTIIAVVSFFGLYKILQVPHEIGPLITIKIGYYFWFASVAIIFLTSCVLTYQGFQRKPESQTSSTEIAR